MMDHDSTLSFGRNLREARRNAGLSQQALADRAGIDRATISLIENDRESPRTDTVLRLADVLGVTPAALWRDPAEGTSGRERMLRETSELVYEPVGQGQLHPGLQELLEDERTRLMLNLTPEEEAMLRSIRTRREAPLGRDFFLDVLISYRRHHSS